MNEAVADLAATTDRKKVLKQLHKHVDAARFAPLESSWRLIDGDVPPEQLKALCVVSMFRWDELSLSRLRQYLFDHPKLWPFLLDEADGAGRALAECL